MPCKYARKVSCRHCQYISIEFKALNWKHVLKVAYSSGNHGLATAWASRLVGIKCSVIIPKTTSECKVTAIQGYGAKVVTCEYDPISRFVFKDIYANIHQMHALL